MLWGLRAPVLGGQKVFRDPSWAVLSAGINGVKGFWQVGIFGGQPPPVCTREQRNIVTTARCIWLDSGHADYRARGIGDCQPGL